ncbi:MAG: metallophosphoesterase [Oscillospiraceae bacterium]|nr:metallophosphoesterase [Oscillospiraceae bacterium]
MTADTPLAFGLELDTGFDEESGLLCACAGSCINFEPLPVSAGDRVALREQGASWRIAFYSAAPDPALLYTYSYQPEANWARYLPEKSLPDWTDGAYTVPADGFLRIQLRSSHAVQLAGALRCEPAEPGRVTDAAWIEAEADRVAARVKALRRGDDAVFLLLADTHYAVGSNWPDTLRSLRAVRDRILPDGVIHLGDLTDGMLPELWTRRYTDRVLDGLRSLGGSFDACLGNHDMNYFRGNEPMSKAACAAWILGRRQPWYYRDLPRQRIRMLFLDSFEPMREERYGFSGRELFWLRRTLAATPPSYRVLLFSHVPPLARLHVWSDTILREEAVLRCLTRFHKRRGGAVLGWVHGHNHTDQLFTEAAFPIVSIGCSKLESFPEYKPACSTTQRRRAGDATQELWDVLILHAASADFDLVRYGAGADRCIAPINTD